LRKMTLFRNYALLSENIGYLIDAPLIFNCHSILGERHQHWKQNSKEYVFKMIEIISTNKKVLHYNKSSFLNKSKRME